MKSKTKPIGKRDIDLGVKISRQEEKLIIQKAKELDLTKSAYVRMIILYARIEKNTV